MSFKNSISGLYKNRTLVGNLLFILAKLSSCVNKHNCNDDAPAEADGEPLAQDGVTVFLLVQANGDQVPCQSLHTASQSARQTIHYTSV